MNWLDSLKTNEPLSRHTTFKIGGPAEYFAQPKTESSLKNLVVLAKKEKMRVLIIGNGSNLLVSDKGMRAIVVKLSAAYFRKLVFRRNNAVVGAGCLISQVIQGLTSHSLSGMEFMAGIPGTIGGALMMNAGVRGKNIADLVEEITVMDYNGNKKKIKREEIRFGYRGSDLAKYILLRVCLKLNREKKEKIKDEINSYLLHRQSSQETALASVGCIFKNPDRNVGAGRLIDLCGLKGRVIGGAMVSTKHANFIVNTGRAKARDVLDLMELVRKEVWRRFNVDLEPEIKIWQ